MRAFLISLLFAMVFSNPIEEEIAIESSEITERKIDTSEDLEAARNARFNFGYSIQVILVNFEVIKDRNQTV